MKTLILILTTVTVCITADAAKMWRQFNEGDSMSVVRSKIRKDRRMSIDSKIVPVFPGAYTEELHARYKGYGIVFAFYRKGLSCVVIMYSTKYVDSSSRDRYLKTLTTFYSIQDRVIKYGTAHRDANDVLTKKSKDRVVSIMHNEDTEDLSLTATLIIFTREFYTRLSSKTTKSTEIEIDDMY